MKGKDTAGGDRWQLAKEWGVRVGIRFRAEEKNAHVCRTIKHSRPIPKGNVAGFTDATCNILNLRAIFRRVPRDKKLIPIRIASTAANRYGRVPRNPKSEVIAHAAQGPRAALRIINNHVRIKI